MRRAIAILVSIQIVFALALAGVVINGITERKGLRDRISVLENDKSQLQARVDALEEYLRSIGIDPGSVPTRPVPHPATTRPTAGASPAPHRTLQPRVTVTPTPERTRTPTARPSPSRTTTPAPSPTCTRLLGHCLLP